MGQGREDFAEVFLHNPKRKEKGFYFKIAI
jgi:hypothetical protein